MQGDCLEKMKLIPAGSVDMVLSDIPYGTTQCKWDAVIPFEPMWEEVRRVLKPNGAAVFTASQPFTSALVMSNPHEFRYDWAWRKTKATNHLNAKKMPLRNKEDILVFSQEVCVYFPQYTEGSPYKAKAGDVEKSTSMTASYGSYTNVRSDNPGRRYPLQVLEFGTVQRNTVHPTQKPVALMEYMIRTYTNEGETVLDFTMGSGTTGVACVNTGRKFIGIERDEGYFQTAFNRINKAVGGQQKDDLDELF